MVRINSTIVELELSLMYTKMDTLLKLDRTTYYFTEIGQNNLSSAFLNDHILLKFCSKCRVTWNTWKKHHNQWEGLETLTYQLLKGNGVSPLVAIVPAIQQLSNFQLPGPAFGSTMANSQQWRHACLLMLALAVPFIGYVSAFIALCRNVFVDSFNFAYCRIDCSVPLYTDLSAWDRWYSLYGCVFWFRSTHWSCRLFQLISNEWHLHA